MTFSENNNGESRVGAGRGKGGPVGGRGLRGRTGDGGEMEGRERRVGSVGGKKAVSITQVITLTRRCPARHTRPLLPPTQPTAAPSTLDALRPFWMPFNPSTQRLLTFLSLGSSCG